MTGVKLNVQIDTKELERTLNKASRDVVPRVTMRALNETATAHRATGTKEIAKDLRIPIKNLRKRFDKAGQVKGERAEIQKATRSRLVANLSVYMRGIPVIQLVTAAQKVRAIGKPPKGGIRAAGGRQYKRGFIAEGTGQSVQVFVRRGKERYPLAVPKIGVRKRLTQEFDELILRGGRAEFRRRWQRLAAYELSRLKG